MYKLGQYGEVLYVYLRAFLRSQIRASNAQAEDQCMSFFIYDLLLLCVLRLGDGFVSYTSSSRSLSHVQLTQFFLF